MNEQQQIEKYRQYFDRSSRFWGRGLHKCIFIGPTDVNKKDLTENIFNKMGFSDLI